jgi:hypothetical protein
MFSKNKLAAVSAETTEPIISRCVTKQCYTLVGYVWSIFFLLKGAVWKKSGQIFIQQASSRMTHTQQVPLECKQTTYVHDVHSLDLHM